MLHLVNDKPARKLLVEFVSVISYQTPVKFLIAQNPSNHVIQFHKNMFSNLVVNNCFISHVRKQLHIGNCNGLYTALS